MDSLDQRRLLDDDTPQLENHDFANSVRSLPPETATYYKSRSTDTDGITPRHVMIASGIGSIGIAFGAIPILVSQSNFHKYALDIIPNIARAVCALILLMFSFAFLAWQLCRTRNKMNDIEKEEQLNSSISVHVVSVYVKIKTFICFVIWDSPSLLQVFVFGIGSMLTSALDVYNKAKSDQAAVNLAHDSIRLFAIFLQMIFYTCFVYVNHVGKLKNLPSWHHVSIAMMIGAQVWLWVSDTTEPLWNLETSSSDIINSATNNATESGVGNSTNNTTEPGVGFIFTLEHFLEPFHVEFSTISIGLLYSIWNMTDQKENIPKYVKHDQYTDSKADRTTLSKWWKSWTFHIILAFIISLFYIVISTIIIFNPRLHGACKNIDGYVFHRLMVYRGIMILYFGMGLPSCTIYVLYNLNSLKVKLTHASLGQYLLVITAIAVMVNYTLRIFAAGYMLNLFCKHELNITLLNANILEDGLNYGYSNNQQNITSIEDISTMISVMLIYPFFLIFQVWLQTLMLMEAERRQNIPKSVKLILVYIIAVNFGEWLQTGIALGFDRDGGKSEVTPIMNYFFTDKSSRIIQLCLYPFMVLYRFHSAVVAWEIIIEDDKEDKHTAMVRTIKPSTVKSVGTETRDGVSRSLISETDRPDVTILNTSAKRREGPQPIAVEVHSKFDDSMECQN